MAKGASGETVWKVRTGSITYEALLALYGQARGMRVMYDPKKVLGDIYTAVPEEGHELRGEGIDLFMQDTLSQSKLVLMPGEHGTAFIIPAIEAITLARAVSPTDIETTNAAEWVTYCYIASHVDANTLRASTQNLVSRNGGSVNPVPGHASSLIITERCDRVRQLVKLLKQIDVPGFLTPVARRYEVPEGVEPQAAKFVVEQLFPTKDEAPGPHAPPNVTAAIVPGKRAIIVRAATRDHEQIAKVIEQLR
jgi:hypothetical protein